jgi:heme/copper-type cytochrome/quinol oxidase subunit 2
MNKNGAALIFVSAIIAIFIVLIVYFSTSKPFYALNDNFNSSAVARGDTRSVESLGRLDTVWRNFPLIIILGIVFWLFIKLVQRQDNSYYNNNGGGQY